jgi:hypothetical protein
MEELMRSEFRLAAGPESEGEAMEEVKRAISDALEHAQPVALPPRSASMRRLQHQLAERHGLSTASKGREPRRFVVIYPTDRHEVPWSRE